MLRTVVLHDIPMNYVAAMERWYFRDHEPEIARRYGPYLHRLESWFPVPAPPEADAFGRFNWRLTEGTGVKFRCRDRKGSSRSHHHRFGRKRHFVWCHLTR
jgi:hypothetical protein